MTSAGPPAGPAPLTTDGYDERLREPLWWWPAAAVVAAVLAVEVHLADRALPYWIGLAITAVLAALAVRWLGRTRVRVAGGELAAADARLPLEYVAEVAPLDERGKRVLLGREGDPAAFLLHRGWIGPAVYLRLNDPDDPTPYWIVSTRHPAELAAAVEAARPA